MEREECTKILKALADDTRMQIFEMLRGGTLCGCKILEQLNITQPTLSHHMKVLEKEELVHVTKKGKWHHYSLNQDTAALLINGLSKTLSNTEDCICKITNKQC